MSPHARPRTLRAVVFDLDDTLYDHREYAQGAYAGVAEAFAQATGLDPRDFLAEILRLYDVGGSRDTTIFRRALTPEDVLSADLADSADLRGSSESAQSAQSADQSSSWRTEQVYLAHFTISDIAAGGRTLFRLRVPASDHASAAELVGRIAGLGLGSPQIVKD